MRTIIFLTFILSSILLSYQDYDIDGVDDTIDKCPDTPFDKLVDQYGCPQDESYRGLLTFIIGNDIYNDAESEQINNINFYLNYTYYQWDLSVSNANYKILETTNPSLSDTGDIFISGGYTFQSDNIYTKLSLGVKIPTSDVDDNASLSIGTGEKDYFTSINVNYLFNKRQNLFLYYGYTLSGDTEYLDYENTNYYSIGTGYALTNRWYSALSYEYSNSIYLENDDYQAISWFNNYNFSNSIFTSINYAYALDENSYDHIFSIKLGVYFE